MRRLLFAALFFAGCAAPQAATKRPAGPAVTQASQESQKGRGTRGGQRTTVCTFTIPGQPEFGMTCKEQ